MNKEEAKKWLSYSEKGLKPTRVKSRSIVYSDNALFLTSNFKTKIYDIKFLPIDQNENQLTIDFSQKHMPAFICEIIVDYKNHKDGGNFDIPAALEEVLPWFEFDYSINLHFQEWEEYEGKWVKSLAAAMSGSSQNGHTKLPKDNIQETINNYELIVGSSSKRSKKSFMIRKALHEGLKLKNISLNYSFLSFYKVIEIISDDLASKGFKGVAHEEMIHLVDHKLIQKSSQRMKVYYLLKTIKNTFFIDEMIHLADLRNKLAHSDNDIEYNHVKNCQNLAFWAAESFLKICTQENRTA